MLTFPAQFADPVHLDGDHDGERLFHAAVVRHHGQDMVVTPLIVKRFRVSHRPLIVDHERLIRRGDLIFADVAELGRAVPI